MFLALLEDPGIISDMYQSPSLVLSTIPRRLYYQVM